MRHKLRRTSLLLVPFTFAALVVGIPTAAPDTTNLQNVALSCDDGTNVGLTLSAGAVTNLTNATTAMTLFPAGLSCGVSTQANPPPGGNPNSDYAVGGGDQFAFPIAAPCKTNFSFSMHTPSNSPFSAQGSFNETIPGGCAGFGDTGELRVDINCLYVTGNEFDAHGTVRKATGQFTTDVVPFTVGGAAYISGHDNGGAVDTLRVEPTDAKPTPCGGELDEAGTMHGRINVSP